MKKLKKISKRKLLWNWLRRRLLYKLRKRVKKLLLRRIRIRVKLKKKKRKIMLGSLFLWQLFY